MGELFKVDEGPDATVIAGQVVRRPAYVSAAEWLRFWEQVKRVMARENF